MASRSRILPTGIAAVALSVASVAAAGPCDAEAVPSIAGEVRVVPPPETLAPRLRGLSGTWGGRWGGVRDSRLVVERVDEREATLVYAIAPYGNGQGPYSGGAHRYTAQVSPDGTLAVPKVGLTFRLRGDGRLDGTFTGGGLVTMDRCDGAAPPVGGESPVPALLVELAAWYAFPLALVVGLSRKLRGEARWVALGAVTWLAALPATTIAPFFAAVALGAGDPARAAIASGAALSVTAGVAEECGRWWFYRRAAARGPMGRREAILAGVGHGATESLVLGLQYAVLPLVRVLRAPDPTVYAWLEEPAVTSAVSRPLIVLGHVAFALLVWRGVVTRTPGRLAAAIGLHVAIDLLAFVVPALAPWTTGAVLVPIVVLAAYAVVHVAAEARLARSG